MPHLNNTKLNSVQFLQFSIDIDVLFTEDARKPPVIVFFNSKFWNTNIISSQ